MWQPADVSSGFVHECSVEILQINSLSSHIYLVRILHLFLFQLFMCRFTKSSPWCSPHFHSHASYFWSGAAGWTILGKKLQFWNRLTEQNCHSFCTFDLLEMLSEKKTVWNGILSVVSHLLSMCSVWKDLVRKLYATSVFLFLVKHSLNLEGFGFYFQHPVLLTVPCKLQNRPLPK